MDIKTILYHGSSVAKTGLERDEARFERFVEHFIKQTPEWGTEALLILPDGKALLKPYYWTGMARISCMDTISAVGARTDLSFSIFKSLKAFDGAGGYREKLRLCAVFHPELMTLARFLSQCQKLIKENISFSVGVFGTPDNLDMIQELRRSLSPDIYLWIESMAEISYPYSIEEEMAFQSIDPLFSKEWAYRPADKCQCQNRLFVESDGKMRLCVSGQYMEGNWSRITDGLPALECRQTICSGGYLAYGGRNDYEHAAVFGRYPMFRIPWKPKAFFFTADKILFHNLEREDSEFLSALKDRRESAPLFLITSLPYKEAARHYHTLLPLCGGGIFAGGAHIVLNKKGRQPRREEVLALDPSIIPILEEKQSEYGCGLRIFQNEDTIYRLTMEKPSSRLWRESEFDALMELIPSKTFRCFIEQNCFHIVPANANEKNGIKTIGHWLSICPEDCVSLDHLS
jgi:hypothetical protein